MLPIYRRDELTPCCRISSAENPAKKFKYHFELFLYLFYLLVKNTIQI